MLREHSLLSVDAVDQRHPTNQHQEKGYKIPFLQVVTNVCEYVRKIHRMADESVGPSRHQTSQSRAYPEESPHSEKTNKTKTSCERYQNQPSRGRRYIPRRPAQVDDLGIGISISDADSHAGSYGVIPHLRPGPS